jgi:hypothetical protein
MQVLSVHVPVESHEVSSLDFASHIGLAGHTAAPTSSPLAHLVAQWMPPRASNTIGAAFGASAGRGPVQGLVSVGGQRSELEPSAARGQQLGYLQERENPADGEGLSDGLLLLWPRGPLVLGMSSLLCAAGCCRCRLFGASSGLGLLFALSWLVSCSMGVVFCGPALMASPAPLCTHISTHQCR